MMGLFAVHGLDSHRTANKRVNVIVGICDWEQPLIVIGSRLIDRGVADEVCSDALPSGRENNASSSLLFLDPWK